LTLFAIIACLGAAVPVQAAGQQIFDGLNGRVWATAVGADGTTYVGGDFKTYGPQTGGGAALASTGTGTVNRTFPPVSGDVYAVTSDGLGGYYIGGYFTHVAGVGRANLAHILGTGDLDPNWNPGANGVVQALAVSAGIVYAGGYFTQARGGDGTQATRYHLAAFDASGNLTAWDPGANSTVWTLAVSGNTVYAGGYFTAAGGGLWGTEATRKYLAAFDTSGNLTDWNPGVQSDVPGLNGAVLALAVSGSTIYAGGTFTTAGGGDGNQATRKNLAAFDTSGGLTAWNPGVGGSVHTLGVSGTTVYVGGVFNSAGGGDGLQAKRKHLAAFDTSGNLLPWNPGADPTIGPGANEQVTAMAVSGSTIYVGGYFTVAGSSATAREHLAAFDASGNLLPWNPGAKFPPGGSLISAMAVSGSTVYVGGQFTQAGGADTDIFERNNLAAFDASGNLTAWNPGVDGVVYTLAVAGSTVYVGGGFYSVGAAPRYNLAAFDASGNLINWRPAASGSVFTLAVSGSTIYAGGMFQTAGTVTNPYAEGRLYLAAFDASGNLLPWNPGADYYVNTLAVAGDTLYAGGGFT
jgi:hypothetical protein